MQNLFRRRTTAASGSTSAAERRPSDPNNSANNTQQHSSERPQEQTQSKGQPKQSQASSSSSDQKGKKPAASDSNAGDSATGSGMFECNICLETASNPVVTLCGHLYCWTCIHKWMTSDRSASAGCPVCKAGVDRGQCIPIYCRGRESVDPRTAATSEGTEETPDRPSGQRPPQQPRFRPFGGSGGFPFQQAFGFGRGANGGIRGGGVQFTTGFGIPFFGLQFNYPDPLTDEELTPEQAFRQLVARTFLIFGLFLLISILLY